MTPLEKVPCLLRCNGLLGGWIFDINDTFCCRTCNFRHVMRVQKKTLEPEEFHIFFVRFMRTPPHSGSNSDKLAEIPPKEPYSVYYRPLASGDSRGKTDIFL